MAYNVGMNPVNVFDVYVAVPLHWGEWLLFLLVCVVAPVWMALREYPGWKRPFVAARRGLVIIGERLARKRRSA